MLQKEDLQILGKFGNTLSVDKMDEAYRIFDEIINNLDIHGIKELMGGYESDLDDIYSVILEETYATLYGRKNNIDLRLGYMDNMTRSIEETLSVENLSYFISSKMPQFDLNWHHLEWSDMIQRYDKNNVIAARDHGKCVSPLTPILMFDGSIKQAKDIKIGDKVMGMDSKPRLVLSLHKGKDEMFRIHQTKGISYDVNSKHTLTLLHKNRITKNREIVDIDINDLQNYSDNWIAERYRGFKVKVDFNKTVLPVDPYFLGYWLGDGNSHNTGITTADFEIVDWLENFSKTINLELRHVCRYQYLLKRIKGTKGRENHLLEELKKLNVVKNKHIPEQYIINSRENRLQLLAGLLDSDANLRHGTFKISSIYRHLSLEIKRLADSLGFHTRFHESNNFNKQLGRLYYNCYVVIGGRIDEIPTKIKRKQSFYNKNKDSNKLDFSDIDNGLNITTHSKLQIEPLGKGDYVGFTVDGDNRFLLADGTVTHNSYFFSNAYLAWKMYRYKPNIGFSRVRKDLALSKRGFLFSFSQQQAVDLLDILKSTIEESDELRDRLFPGRGDGWAKTDITAKNGARITTKGFGSSVRGAHPGYIVIDDGLKDNVIYSSVQRKKSIDYFHAVIMNMIVPGGQTTVVGTPFHANDLYGDLKTKQNWNVREYPAIFPDGKILWRERWDFNGLLDKRETQGNMIFSRENLCRPVTNESSIFPQEVIERAYVRMEDYTFVRSRSAFKMKFDRVVVGVDFSISSSVGADYTVIIVAGIDENDNMWLMNITRFKGKSFSEQLAVLKTINQAFTPDLMVLEDNVFQQIFVQEADRAGLPVEGHTTGKNKYDLKAGLPGLAILFERGKIRIPRGNQDSKDQSDSLAIELSSVTWTDKGLEGVGEHDDQAMCLWLTSVAAKKLTSGFSFKFL